jgi:RNA polymerase sigma-70 factor, ECF subfamily
MLPVMSDERAKMPDNVIPLTGSVEAHNDAARHAETLLLVRVRDNADREAYRELFDSFIPRLRAYARNQGCDVAAAENVVQDVMVTAWTRAHLFDHEKASARTWIYTLVRNRLIDQHRAGERRQRAYDGYATTFSASTTEADSAERSLCGSRVTALLAELPDEQAQAVLMVYIEGKSHREIAEQLNVPIGTIKSRTRLALQRLRKLMEEPA